MHSETQWRSNRVSEEEIDAYLKPFDRALTPRVIRLHGQVRKMNIRREYKPRYGLYEHGAHSLSSLIAVLLGECEAHSGYTQGGQCKSCSKEHDPPDFRSINCKKHQRMVEFIERKGWEWQWTDYKNLRELSLVRWESWLKISGDLSKDAALMIATALLCSTHTQLEGFRENYRKLFPLLP